MSLRGSGTPNSSIARSGSWSSASFRKSEPGRTPIWPRRGIGSNLYDIEQSLGSILSFSFFITKEMKTDLQAGPISGTLPLLYVFLARSGKTIRDVSLIALDDKGATYFANENAGTNITRGVRIVFASGDGQEKTLYYFATDLSNRGVKSSGFLQFCQTLAP